MKKENIKLNNSQNLVLVVLLLTFSFLLFPFAVSAGTINKPPNNLGLTGYWSLNEGSGSIAGDASGNGRNGTLTNMDTTAVWVAGKRGKALLFDGVNDYVATGVNMNQFFSISTGTVSVWVKPTGSSPSATQALNATRIFGGSAASNFAPGISRGTVDGLDRIWAFNYVSGYQKVGVEYANGEWTHIVLVHSLGTLYIYKNGVLGGSIASGDSTSMSGAGTGFGGSSSANYFNGTIDEVRTYSRSLSASEILALYQSGATKIGLTDKSPGTLKNGLTGHWTFDGKDMVSNVADVSGNGRNGVFTGTGTISTTTAIGKIGQALNFNSGNNKHVSTVALSNLIATTTGTISAWVRPTGAVPSCETSAMYDCQFAVANNAVLAGDGIAWGNNTTLGENKIWAVNSTYALTFQVVGATYNMDEWVHITWVHSGGILSIYKNGEFVASVSAGNTYGLEYTFLLGRGWTGTSNIMNGDVDDVRTYNRALTASEIKQVYNLGAGQKVAKTSTPVGTLQDGLMGYWSFDGADISGTTVTDKSGNGNNGTLTNGPVATIGKIGQGLNFDGSNDYVDLGDKAVWEPSRTQSFSVAFWYKGLGSNRIFISHSPQPGTNYWYITEGVALFCGGSSCIVNRENNYTLPSDNGWHHLVVVLDRSTSPDSLNVFLDGVATGTQTGTLDNNSTTWGTNTRIGAPSWAGGTYRQGPMDEVRIYNRALSAAEAKQLYLLGK